MLRSSALLLALAAVLGATHETTGRSGLKGAQANLLLPGGNSLALSLTADCDAGEADCDGFCIPKGEVCCRDGDGSSCNAGRYCTSDGCCPKGKVCTGGPTGCDDGKELCGKYCIPEGSVCCEEADSYCEKGDTCTSDGFCEPGSGGSSDDDDDSDGASGSGTCLSSQEKCDGYCMPAGSVCCGDGYYCDEDETCTDDGKCDPGSGDESSSTNSAEAIAESSETASASADDDDDDDDDDEPTETDSSSSEPTSESGSTLCRRKGGKINVDVDDDDDCADGAEDDDDAAAGLAVPAMLAGLMAMVPLFL